MSYVKTVNARAVHLTAEAMRMTAAAGSGHPTSAASLAHLTAVLLYDHMRFPLERPDHPAADRLVLSEGHACPIVYAAAADLGIAIGRGEDRRPAEPSDLDHLREIDSELDGHPSPAEGFPFFPAATGSLGQGLSVATGIALAARLDGLGKRVFCIIGDGESREGQIHEAVDFMLDHRLRAVCPIFNMNGYGQTGPVSAQQSKGILSARLEACGLEVLRIDGHDPIQVRDALKIHAQRCDMAGAQPVAIVAHTVKGWGMPCLQVEHSAYHGKPATGQKLEQAQIELAETARRLGVRTGGGEFAERTWSPPEPKTSRTPGPEEDEPWPGLLATLRERGRMEVIENGVLAPRKAYGLALRVAGLRNSAVVVLDGDVSNSTYSEEFRTESDLAERFFEGRIAEQNIVSAAVGLATEGKVPCVSSFGKFLSRAYDQFEMGIVTDANLKLVGSHVGVSLAADGPSQMALTDAGYFRALSTARRTGGDGPATTVLTPSDAFSAFALTRAMIDHQGACYLRLIRPDVPFLYDEETAFPLGGHRLVADGGDLVIAAWGYMVHEALRARERLAGEGIDAAVADLYCLPFDESALRELVKEHSGRILTVEDNYAGALGSAVAETLATGGLTARLDCMTVRRIPRSGRTPSAVLEDLGLSEVDIAGRARRLVEVHA